MNFISRPLFLLFFSSQLAFAGEVVRNNIPVNPDIEKTPGDFCTKQDRDFKELRYQEKMAYCERNVSQWLKTKIYNAYNIPEKCRHRYTVDHLVPLALGGNNAPENLWPEHVLVKKTRQELEIQLFWEVNKNNLKSQDAVEVLLEEKIKLQLDLSHVEGCG
jgi:hypothetical protein